MKNNNSKFRIAAIVLSLILIFPIISMTAVSASSEYMSDGAASFVFSDGNIDVGEGDFDGYKISGTELSITKEGTYILSGDCADGSVKVKKGTTGVTLVLNGLSLTSSATAPIVCNKSSEVRIIVAAETVNNLTDNAINNDEAHPDNVNAENAVIKCKDGSKVTIEGSGTLNITANGKNGIKSGATTDEEGEAFLIIKDVTLNIEASVNDAINAEQLINIESGNLNISAADDAIHSDLEMNIGAPDTNGPVIKISSCYEGLEAATLNIYSGNIDINASDDCLNAANSDLGDYGFSMNISGGSIVAYSSSGDGFDSNGSITISGGTVEVWTADTADNQPLDADGVITISGGTVLAAGGSGGMGINLSATQGYVIYGTSGGMGGQPGDQPGGNGNTSGSQPPQLPGGGTQSDGNGNGKNRPNGLPAQSQQPGQEQNGPRPETPDGENSVELKKDSAVVIKDESGNDVYRTTALCDTGYVLFSSPELISESGYTLYTENTSVASSTAKTGTFSGTEGQQPGNPDDGRRPPEFDENDKTNRDEEAENSGEPSSDGSTQPSKESETGKTASPKTGDGACPGVFVAALAISFVAIILYVYYRKKSRKNRI